MVNKLVAEASAPAPVAAAPDPAAPAVAAPKPAGRLRSAVIADLEAAIAIAKAGNDPYGVQCHTAGLAWFQSLPSCEVAATIQSDLPPAAGIFSEAERVRLFRMRVEAQAGVIAACTATVKAIVAAGAPPSLVEACAVVYHDAQSTGRRIIAAFASLLP
jgi:hypothetical protein